MLSGAVAEKLAEQLAEIHAVVVGDGRSPGLAEAVRTHDRQIKSLGETQAGLAEVIHGNGREGLGAAIKRLGRQASRQTWLSVTLIVLLFGALVRSLFG